MLGMMVPSSAVVVDVTAARSFDEALSSGVEAMRTVEDSSTAIRNTALMETTATVSRERELRLLRKTHPGCNDAADVPIAPATAGGRPVASWRAGPSLKAVRSFACGLIMAQPFSSSGGKQCTPVDTAVVHATAAAFGVLFSSFFGNPCYFTSSGTPPSSGRPLCRPLASGRWQRLWR